VLEFKSFKETSGCYGEGKDPCCCLIKPAASFIFSSMYADSSLIYLLNVPQSDQHQMLDQVESGFCHRRLRKRAKSPSVEHSINPCSMASDAR
jgi:hypothetical protein